MKLTKPAVEGVMMRGEVLHVDKYENTLLVEIEIKTGSAVPHPIDLFVSPVEHGKWEGSPE